MSSITSHNGDFNVYLTIPHRERLFTFNSVHVTKMAGVFFSAIYDTVSVNLCLEQSSRENILFCCKNEKRLPFYSKKIELKVYLTIYYPFSVSSCNESMHNRNGWSSICFILYTLRWRKVRTHWRNGSVRSSRERSSTNTGNCAPTSIKRCWYIDSTSSSG